MKRILLYCLSGFICLSLQAQLTVSTSMSTQQLLDQLFGLGVVVSNVNVTCDTSMAIGSFDGSNSNIGLPDGVLMSTGDINNALPGGFIGTALNTPGDPDLTNYLAIQTYDACVIEFDVVSVCDTIAINYVFASYEYPNFVGFFNDGFAFLISGPGYTGLQNIAMIPGSTLPVAINNVNAMTNSQYYVANTGGPTVGYNGFTTPFLAYASVIPDSTYHIKLVIADALDQTFDSGIFLRNNGVCANPNIIAMTGQNSQGNVSNNTIQVEENSIANLNMAQALPASGSKTFSLELMGTAAEGVDFDSLPATFTLMAGETDISLDIQFLNDCENEGPESLTIVYTDASLMCNGQPWSDTISFEIMDMGAPAPIDLGPDLSICSNDVIVIGIQADSNMVYNWQGDLTAINDPVLANPTFVHQVMGSEPDTFEYVLMATDDMGCTVQDTIILTVFPEIESGTIEVAGDLCAGDTLLISHDALYANQYDWMVDNVNVSSDSILSYVFADSGTYTVHLMLHNDACYLELSTTLTIEECSSGTNLQDLLPDHFVQLFPNPANEVLHVSLHQKMEGQIVIQTLQGKSLQAQAINGIENQVDVSSLAKGLYLLEIQTDKGHWIAKWLKN